MELSNQEKPKKNKTKQTILILLIVSIIAVIITISLMFYLSNKKEEPISKADKIYVDGEENGMAASQIILKTSQGKKYLEIKKLAELIGYNYFNGEYLKYTEDKTKCYIENIIQIQTDNKNEVKNVSNIVGLEANSNRIYKTTSDSNLDYEYIEIKNQILQNNGILYISIEDIRSCS